MDRLILEGLTGDEQLALREEIETDDLEIQSPSSGGARAGEPASIAVILLGKLALLGLSAFLLKRRRKSQQRQPDKIRIGKLTFESEAGKVYAENLELDFPAGNESPEDLAQLINKTLSSMLDSYANKK